MNGDKKLYFEIININLLKILVDVLDKTSEDIRLSFSNVLKKKNNSNDSNDSNNVIDDNLLEISCTNNTKNCFIKSKFLVNYQLNLMQLTRKKKSIIIYNIENQLMQDKASVNSNHH